MKKTRISKKINEISTTSVVQPPKKKKYNICCDKEYGLVETTTPRNLMRPPTLEQSHQHHLAPIILHLRISPLQTTNEAMAHISEEPSMFMTENTLLEYSPLLSIPQPYENKEYTFLSSEEEKSTTNDPHHEKSLDDYLPQIQYDVHHDRTYFISSSATSTSSVTTCHKLLNSIQKNEHIMCWWCCHSFSWNPIFLPTHKSKEQYSVVGYFCSPECCTGYMFDHPHRYGDVWKQYQWLHELYGRKVDNTIMKIKQAPPRELLRIFGGVYTIQEFRKYNDNYLVDMKRILPPLYPSNGYLEECVSEQCVQKFVPLDKNRVMKATEELKLKRKSQHNIENTLDKFMNLKISSISST